MSHEFESGFFSEVGAWHGLGNTLDKAPTMAEGIKQAGLDWEVIPAPVVAKVLNSDGNPMEVDCPDNLAMIRSSDKSVLSVRSSGYHPLQNSKCFEFFDKFLESGEATLETAGSLRKGKLVWVLVKIGDPEDITGDKDKIVPYFLISNAHDGTQAVRGKFTSVRVVCKNTHTQAMNAKGDSGFSIFHTQSMEKNLDIVKASLDIARREFQSTIALLRSIQQKEIHYDELEHYARTVLGEPKDVELYYRRVAEGKNEKDIKGVAEVCQLFRNGPGADLAGNTIYGAYNAVTHYLDHHKGRNSETRLNSSWFGINGKKREKAFSLACDIVGV